MEMKSTENQLSLDQGSLEWLEWRRGGIGSSDVAAIMGLCPHRTPLDVYLDKIGQEETHSRNDDWALYEGHRLEPKARAALELQYGLTDFSSKLVQSATYSYLRASLDGFNEKLNVGCEIKFVGRDKHELVKKGIIPENYRHQIQYQIFLSAATHWLYVSYFKEEEQIEVIRVEPDIELMKRIVDHCHQFWKRVENKEPPAMSDRDRVNIEEVGLLSQIEKWRGLTEESKALQLEADALKQQIVEKLPHTNCFGSGVSMKKVVKKGNIDYKKVPELKNVDLERFRSSQVEYYTFRILESQ